jgi:hypothetical protein
MSYLYSKFARDRCSTSHWHGGERDHCKMVAIRQSRTKMSSNRTGGAPSIPDLEKEIEVSNIAPSSLDESSSIFGTIIVGVQNMFIEGQKRWRNRERS